MAPLLIFWGHQYPALIRSTPDKPIRVFIQDGANDLNNQYGDWFLANQQMVSALKNKNYDVKAVWGLRGIILWSLALTCRTRSVGCGAIMLKAVLNK